MSTVLAERQTSLLEMSTEGERKWKNPNQVVRIRRKLSRKSSLKVAEKHNQAKKENVQPSKRPLSGEKATTPVLKRASENVLASPTPPKRSRNGLQDISNSPLPTPTKVQDTSLPTLTKVQDTSLPTPTGQSDLQESLAVQRRPCLQSSDESCCVSDSDIPLDWALKTKVRFTSPFPFSWAQSLKPHQEATGIMRFVENSAERKSGDQQTALQQGLMFWTHPSLPFLKTFPRMGNRQKATPTPAILQDEDILQTLKDDWSTSLCSVYQLLKCNLCPYFYLCANQFTVLFMSAGVCGYQSLSAIITPTTSGMREALKKEGAVLSLPLAPTKLPGHDEEEYSDTEDDGTASNWLTTMGLPAQDFPTLPLALQRSREEFNIDNHPESVACVEGSSVHVLFNYLLTSKTTITTTGSHAGVPPTILAPVGFKGATLKALKVKQGNVQELSEGQMVRRFYLELTGPILPQNLHTLSGLFQTTQHGQFTAHMTNVDATGAFNGRTDQTKDTAIRPESHIQKRPLGQKYGLKEIACENYHFTWT